ncbi:hydro-lyase, Fe-S type, tartrate/fumarate subfamily, alpha subunit [Desulfarculus baarsii DSM 2075]|uniref:Hydro-lyase, Fe-S type, tartrate/fumarate subfamily, alpha subunit n=1 Tax=Desulfarculus baarsii (strain ATCC 33931 / DSM 2075 / LMG 7858 / VKM B-1802 / 2st14) TaxID=644282 RepID=E1QIN8_DESB2|nr:fumarate hydratase [Desulfarculus baarsii]ADK84461.1 hydro-lyase, Fe-S type, tartrate/fumarate subfamily, alpha subunit [Desulfarculus baarsii DSM 2075]
MSDLRVIDVGQISRELARLCGEAGLILPDDVSRAFASAMQSEPSPVGREVLQVLIDNARLAAEERLPICQDCGLAVVFVDVGQDVHLVGGDLAEAVNAGVRQGYQEHYLRKSVCHPFSRANTGDNTPCVVHTRIVPGDKVRLSLLPKGGGSENMSRVLLLTPAQGLEGVKKAVLEAVLHAGPNPCPPIILGVAVGGTFDDAAVRAKRVFLRHLGSQNPDPEAAALEAELLAMVNDTGIGPAGLGGGTTCLGVFVDIAPCHIASLPVAINVQCHAARHKEAVL